jgi:hypothetical protein
MTFRDYFVLLGSVPSWFVVYRYLCDNAATSSPGYPVASYLPALGATGLVLVLVLVYLLLRGLRH